MKIKSRARKVPDTTKMHRSQAQAVEGMLTSAQPLPIKAAPAPETQNRAGDLGRLPEVALRKPPARAAAAVHPDLAIPPVNEAADKL